jgi:GAF domain-containing protein
MTASTDNVGSALQQLAEALRDDLKRIAERSVSRMQEQLPAYAEVPAEALLPVTLTNTRNLLEAVLDPGADPGRAEDHFRMSGETRSRQGVTADALLQAWRIGVESVREEAHAVAGRLGISDDVLLQFVEATLQWGDVGMRVSAQAHREAEIRELQRLAAEQAALRRVATLVARESSPEEVFAQVADEVGLLVEADTVGLFRYERDEHATLVAAWGRLGRTLRVGSRFGLDDDNVTALVYRTRRPARFDAYDDATGPVGEYALEVGLRSACGTPIFVGGRMWGAIVVGSSQREAMIADAESRMEGFTELVATAISNIEARSEVQELAEEQAALRRVAELVAHGASETEIFRAIAEEIGRLLGTDEMRMTRYESDRYAVNVANASKLDIFPVGSRWPLDGESVASRVYHSGRPARIDDYAAKGGPIAEGTRSGGVRGVVGTPILVRGQVWGAMTTGTVSDEPLPPDTEARLGQFTELMATAIANAEARAEVERLAEEQAALRRVAELVAREASQTEIFTAIAGEIAQLLGTDEMRMTRYENDRDAVIVASASKLDIFPVGSHWPLDGENVASRVYHTGQPARIDDYAGKGGPIVEGVRSGGMRGVVGTPILVRGQVWGSMLAATVTDEPLPLDTEARLGQFTELMATAIANADARAEVERLAEEQAALRRVATLVAQGAPPSEVFDAVAAEMNQLLGADGVTLSRYEPDEEVVVLAHRGADSRRPTAGTRVRHRGENVTSFVRSSARSARLEHQGGTPGAITEIVGQRQVRASVGAPIVVDGRLWGVAVANWRGDKSPPADTEERMAKFAELLDTAIANADSRDQLTASRARLLTEADEARRRVVRDLHDGAQQRLVHTIITLKLAQRALQASDEKVAPLISEALERAQQGNAELRELAHGILPSVLTQGGLRGGVNTIVSRLELPVEVKIPADRFPAEIEASAYFVAAEALTNVVKHANAGRAEVVASVEGGMLRVEIRDDGVGGADREGHGLVGLHDRVTALGGWLEVESPASGGTVLTAALPLSAR